MILLLLLVAAILALGAFLTVDYFWGPLPPMPRLRRCVHGSLVVAALAPFAWWFGAAVQARRDYAAESAKVQAQAQSDCRLDPEHGSVERCVAVVMGEWTDSFPAPGWFQW